MRGAPVRGGVHAHAVVTVVAASLVIERNAQKRNGDNQTAGITITREVIMALDGWSLV